MPDRCPLNLDRPCPTVRTVGDLTARHIGKRVRVDIPDRLMEGALIGLFATNARPIGLHIDTPDGLWIVGPEVGLSPDTPCEVIE